MQRSLFESGKKRRAMGVPSGGNSGAGEPGAAGDSFLASQTQALPPLWIKHEQDAVEDAAEPGSNGDSPQGDGETAAAAALASVMPALFELLTQLLILDRSMHSSWR